MKDVKEIQKRAHENVNKAHADSLEDVAKAYTEEEAVIVIDILSKKYPLLMFEALEDRHNELIGKLRYINEAFSDDRR